MFNVVFTFIFSAVFFITLIYICLCTAYLLDYCVRLVTNDRYVIISKVEK